MGGRAESEAVAMIQRCLRARVVQVDKNKVGIEVDKERRA